MVQKADASQTAEEFQGPPVHCLAVSELMGGINMTHPLPSVSSRAQSPVDNRARFMEPALAPGKASFCRGMGNLGSTVGN